MLKFILYVLLILFQNKSYAHEKIYFGAVHAKSNYSEYWSNDNDADILLAYKNLTENAYYITPGEFPNYHPSDTTYNRLPYKFYNLKLKDTVYLLNPKTGKTCTSKIQTVLEFLNWPKLKQKKYSGYDLSLGYNDYIFAKDSSCEEIEPIYKGKDFRGESRFISIGSKMSFAGIKRVSLTEKENKILFQNDKLEIQLEKKKGCIAYVDFEQMPIPDNDDLEKIEGSLLKIKINNQVIKNNTIFTDKSKYEYPNERCVVNPILYKYPENNKYLLYFESYISPYSFVKRFNYDKYKEFNPTTLYTLKACLIENDKINCNELRSPVLDAYNHYTGDDNPADFSEERKELLEKD